MAKPGPKPFRTDEEKREAARQRAARYRERNPEKAREISRLASKARKAAKALAEGRVPGRVGNPKRQSKEDRLEYLARWRMENADVVRKQDAFRKKEKRRLTAEAEGRVIKIGAPVRFTPEERQEHARLNSRSYRRKYPEHAAKIDADYYATNKQQIIARCIANSKRFREKFPDIAKKRSRRYYENNIEGSRARVRNRRARSKAASGTHSAADIAYLFKLQKGKCVFCLKPLIQTKFHVDHHTPLSKGGSNDRSNLRLLHNKCNISKGARDPAEHALRNGLLCW